MNSTSLQNSDEHVLPEQEFPIPAGPVVREVRAAPTTLDRSPASTRIHPLPKWKRAADLLGASFGLVLLAPLFLVVALLIKLTSRGPVLFRHERYGYRGRPFYVWKFRSMYLDTNPNRHRQHLSNIVNQQGVLKKIDNDANITWIGRWLRSTAIDELPQLLNVLKGEMSLVGPRPDVVPLSEHEPWQRARFDVVPGLTGLWQVSGKNKLTFVEMIQLDEEYVRQRSPWMDFRILLMTIPAILKQVFEELLPSRFPVARDD